VNALASLKKKRPYIVKKRSNRIERKHQGTSAALGRLNHSRPKIRRRVEQTIQSGIVRPTDGVRLNDDDASVVVTILEIGSIEDDVRA